MLALAISRLEDGGFQYRGTFKSSATLPFRVFTDAISILPFIPTDLKVRGYFAFGIPSLQTLFSTLPFISTCSRTRGYSPLGIPSFRRLVFVRHVLRLGGDSLGLCAFLYVMLKFAVKREQSQACLSYAEPTNETRAEDACILCLVRRRKTKSP